MGLFLQPFLLGFAFCLLVLQQDLGGVAVVDHRDHQVLQVLRRGGVVVDLAAVGLIGSLSRVFFTFSKESFLP